MFSICYASTNKSKLEETVRICGRLSVDWRLYARPDGISVPDETGRSFLSNAYLKAAHTYTAVVSSVRGTKGNYHAACDGVLAEDSGLCIDALDGAPGIYSARFGGIPSGRSQCAYLLDRLQDEGIAHARAFYISASILILRSDDETCPQVYCGVGTTHGRIMSSLRGQGGFGYDPIFYSEDLGRGMAEADSEQKSTISHRYRGLVALCRNIESGRYLQA